MTLLFHPRIRNDLREILAYYDARSDTAGDRFFLEFEAAIAAIKESPERFHLVDNVRRRCNLKRFPYHLIYEIHSEEIRVTVLRHDKRRPTFGLRRQWN